MDSQWSRKRNAIDGVKVIALLSHNRYTVRQITEHFGWSNKKMAQRWLAALETMGAPLLTEDSDDGCHGRPAIRYWLEKSWVRQYFNLG